MKVFVVIAVLATSIAVISAIPQGVGDIGSSLGGVGHSLGETLGPVTSSVGDLSVVGQILKGVLPYIVDTLIQLLEGVKPLLQQLGDQLSGGSTTASSSTASSA